MTTERLLRREFRNHKSFIQLLVVLASFALFGASQTEARNLHGKLGIGYNNEFANAKQTNATPGISLKYGLTRDIAAALIVGLNTASPTNNATGAKFFTNIFYETNLNFYFMLGGAIVSANDASGFDFITGLGAEFFIPGLESLAFSVETGISVNNIAGDFVVQTIGVSILDAGVHFYF